jgi:gamma-glutamyltranspeptidase / glutathione hydrolase
MMFRQKVVGPLLLLLACAATSLPAAAQVPAAPEPPAVSPPAAEAAPPAATAPVAVPDAAAPTPEAPPNSVEGLPAAAAPPPSLFHRHAHRGQAWVVAANPLAVEAGLEILRKGGTAVDAAVAVQAMLGLVEPQSSGIGGGAFLMYYDARAGEVSALDGREKAPAGASPTMFLDEHGKPLSYFEAVRSGRSTGVPGVVAMLYTAHRRYGGLSWRELFQPAIRAASDGFQVPARMAGFLGEGSPFPPTNEIRMLFARPDGGTVEAGDVFRNPDYVRTLTRLALEGPSALYSGSIADELVKVTHQAPLPGTMTL